MRTLLAMLLLAVGVSYSNPPAPSPLKPGERKESQAKEPKATSAKQDQATSPTPPIHFTVNTGQEKNRNPGEGNEKSSTEGWTAIATWLAAIATGIAALYAGRQFYLLRVQLDLMNKNLHESARSATAAEESAVAAKISAESAKDAGAVAGRQVSAMYEIATAVKANSFEMQEMLRTQMRAYISVDGADGIYQDAKHVFQGTPTIQNTGLTPARNICFQINSRIFNGDLPDDFTFPYDKSVKRNDAALFSGKTYTLRAPSMDNVSEEDRLLIMAGAEKRLVVWGFVTYDDVYGKNWHTNFCFCLYFLRKLDEKGAEVDVKPTCNYHSTHNDST